MDVLPSALEERGILATKRFDLLTVVGEDVLSAPGARKHDLVESDGGGRLGELSPDALFQRQERLELPVRKHAGEKDLVVVLPMRSMRP
jgi:hypothetical protein